MRAIPRQRRPVGRPLLLLLAPFVRYSVTRDAFILRGVGNRWGPVLVDRTRSPTAGARSR